MGNWQGIELDDLVVPGPRLTLRRWQPEDAAAVRNGVSGDPWMAQFLPVPVPYTAADAAEFVNEIGQVGRVQGTGFDAAVTETATGRVVGGCGLRLPIGHLGRCDLGYSIYPADRGHGYAAEVSDRLARWAFEHGIGRVEIHCSVRNIASAKTALAAGFAFEAVLRQDQRLRDRVDDGAIFARLRSDPGTRISPALAALPVDGLTDGVVTLRVARPADAQAMSEEHDDPLQRSWQFDDDPADAEVITARAASAQLRWLVGPVGHLTMVDAATGSPAGSMQLRLSGPLNVGSIGYGVHPAFRGRAFTTRALRLLMAWAFTDGNFERLELGAKVANIASQKSAVNAGFEPDGIRLARLRNPDGTFSDEARFAALRPGGYPASRITP